MFDKQLEKLEELDCPQDIVSLFRNKRDKVLKNSILFKYTIPYIPVIPLQYSSIYDQMNMIKKGIWRGYSGIRPYTLFDLVETPKDPYYIFGIKKGLDTTDQFPSEVRKELKSFNRRPLTVAEVIALQIHYKILEEIDINGVDAAASEVRWSFEDFNVSGTPQLFMTIARIGLGWDYEAKHPEWITPSCLDKEYI